MGSATATPALLEIPGQKIFYQAEPTAARFHASTAWMRALKGPIGSGKSVACCIELLRRATEQAPDVHGFRRTRLAVIRNTYSELKSTTIKTWEEWVPPEICRIVYDSPIRGHVFLPLPDGTTVSSDIIFLPLDRPKDVRRLLSLELTGAWVNEAREIEFGFISNLAGRVGRFPGKSIAPLTWDGIIMDTNPPSTRHWWYDLASGAANVDDISRQYDPAHTAYHLRQAYEHAEEQQPGITPALIDEIADSLNKSAGIDPKKAWAFFDQPPALEWDKKNHAWIPHPLAENWRNQPKGFGYWMQRALVNANDDEWIKIYILGEYGSIFAGQPIYKRMYRDAYHCTQTPIPVLPGLPLYFGFDFGLTPACVVGQVTPMGQVRILREWVCSRGGLRQHLDDTVLPALHAEEFARNRTWLTWADPAGETPDQTNILEDCFTELRKSGFLVQPALSNLLEPRLSSVRNILGETIGAGEPCFLMDGRCTLLRDGFLGGYHYRRLDRSGLEKYSEVPDKNVFSHPHDALQYVIMGIRGGGGHASRSSAPSVGRRYV